MNREQREFVAMAIYHEMPEERIDAWLYCNAAHSVCFPNASWSVQDVQDTSNQTLSIYREAQLAEMKDKTRPTSSSATFKHVAAHKLAEVAVGFGIGFFGALLGAKR